MRLTTFTDYSLRVLIYLGLRPEGRATIAEMAEAYAISRNHLMKVVHTLGQLGYVETLRGKGGGIRLALAPEQINVGRVVRETEVDLEIVECFGPGQSACRIVADCTLKGVLGQALAAFLAVLDRCTLADLLRNPGDMPRVLGLE